MTYLSRGGRRRRGAGVTSLVLSPSKATFLSCQLHRTSDATTGEVLRVKWRQKTKVKAQQKEGGTKGSERVRRKFSQVWSPAKTWPKGCCLNAVGSPTSRPVGLACQHRLLRCRVRRPLAGTYTRTRGGTARPKRCIQGTANVCLCDLYITTGL